METRYRENMWPEKKSPRDLKQKFRKIKKKIKKKDLCVNFGSFFKGGKFPKTHFTNTNRCAKMSRTGSFLRRFFRIYQRIFSHFQWLLFIMHTKFMLKP